MSQNARHEVLQNMQYHYLRAADQSAKSALLDTAEQLLGVGRKYLIRRFNRATDSRAPKPRTGRPVRYGPAIKAALKNLWLAMDQPCSKHLKAGLEHWIPSWEQRHGPYAQAVKPLLLSISPAQMDRLLADIKTHYPAKVRPSSINEVRRQIPIRQGPWETTGPGWFEADTVFHSGGDPSGSFVRSLCVTDIYSGWTEIRATWNQTHHRVHERLREIEDCLPVPLLGFDSDNGSEMINQAVLAYLRHGRPRPAPVEITRSRPYHKNDNAHVEQKNRTHIREFIGYERIDQSELVEPLNRAYQAWSLLRNLYHPSSKLLRKERRGSRIIKQHETRPQTACQRILDHPKSSAQSKAQLQALLKANDPLSLRGEVESRLREFYTMQTCLQASAGAGRRAVDMVSATTASGAGAQSSLRSPCAPAPAPSVTLTISTHPNPRNHPRQTA